MRISRSWLGGLLGVAGLCAMAGTATVAQDLLPQSPLAEDVEAAPVAPDAGDGVHVLTRTDVDAWLDGFMPYALGEGDIAGAVVVVVQNGEVVTQRGYGYSNVEERSPVDPERTLFRPGSVSKLITWTAVMQQVEQGRIDLDADVNEYLDFEIPERNGEPVTMRNIMTHTAGFEEQLKNLIGHDPETMPSYDILLRRWVPHRIFDAGTTPAYSNYATSLAGYIVERVSGEPFDDYVETHIFQPLGMEHSSFRQPLPENMRPLMANGYTQASGEVVPFELVGPGPAGAMSSTGADMARFMLAHLQGGELDGNRILEADTANEMHRTALTIIPGLNRMLLGFFETNINGREVIAHLGDTDAFHTSLHLWIDDNTGIYISVNSNGDQGAAGHVRTALFEQFADRYFPGEPDMRRVDPDTAAEHAQMMTGNWEMSRRADSSFLNITQLMGQITVTTGPDGELILPAGLSFTGRPASWVEVEPFIWQDINSHERIGAIVENGEVVRFSLSTMAPFTMLDRVPWYKDAGLLMPLIQISLVILLLTALLWPVRALVRRHFKVSFPLTGRALLAYRLSRLGALLILLVLMGWATLITMLFANLTNLGPAFDPFILIMQVLSFIVFFGALAVFVWNLWLVWTGKRRWTAKLWSIALVFAAVVIIWIGLAFHLLSIGANY